LTIEKDWWGGYLTITAEDGDETRPIPAYLTKIKQKYKPNPLYKVENTVRLIIIGSSIAFFFVMCGIELAQSFFILGCVISQRLNECILKF
jgi:hypothetical protein